MPPAELPARKRWLALVVLCVPVLVANLDSTVLNVTLPTLVRDLNATSGDLQWIVDSYIVVFAGSLLAAGSLADRIGRKTTLLAGLAVFAGGSAWAAFSGDVGTLIAARASMGIGGALMIPSTLSIISNMFRDPVERQRAIGRWGGTSGIGVALGPIIGGFLLAHFWWGSVFLLNVPIAMAGLLAAYWLVPDSKNPAAKAPDLAGAGLSMAGIGVILWSIIEAPTRGWSSPLVIGAGAGGLTVLALFAVWERITVHPMLNLSFFRQCPFSAAIPAVVTLTFGLFGALFVLTQFLQLSLGFTALQAGIRLLPVAAAIIVVAPVSAVGVRGIGPKFIIAAGLALVAAGLWLISGAAVSTAFTGLAAGMVLLGTGAGLALPTATGSVVGSVPPTESGVASAADTTAIQLGGALGVAVVGSLLATRYQDRMTRALSGRPLPATVKNSLGGALAAGRAGGTTGPLIHLAKTAFISGMDLGLLTGAAVAVAGCLVVLICLPPHSGRNDQLIGSGRGFPLRSLDPRAVLVRRLAARDRAGGETRVDEMTDEPLYRNRVCGIDIGKAQMVVTIRVPSDRDPARRSAETRTFATTKRGVLALADWSVLAGNDPMYLLRDPGRPGQFRPSGRDARGRGAPERVAAIPARVTDSTGQPEIWRAIFALSGRQSNRQVSRPVSWRTGRLCDGTRMALSDGQRTSESG
jgi:EmrB/QacA subfamily drug resistance transporter